MGCNADDIFAPGPARRLATNLCHDYGGEVDEYESSSVGPLVTKLLALTPLQELALTDAVEQARYWMKEQGRPPMETFSRLGIAIA